MAAPGRGANALSWEELGALTSWSKDYIEGPTNSQSTLRLFGRSEDEVRVTLFRDNHAWCPYCQKVWLFMEERQIPYRVAKVTMRCYGKKEPWYLEKVPNGMLPALEIDGHVVTESDDILAVLEASFGPVGAPMAKITPYRKLERQLFRAWCQWLCYPARDAREEAHNKACFEQTLAQVDAALQQSPGPFFLSEFSLADIVFVPYVERMVASLFYYKGFNMKDASPALARWFEGLEQRETYRGMQSDAHTHCHDLPPQMGGCYENGSPEQQACKALVDQGPWLDGRLPDCSLSEPLESRQEALARVIKHRDAIVTVNCVRQKAVVDGALRAALTTLMAEDDKVCTVDSAAGAQALVYIRDRVNAPRDMSVWAARRFRTACTEAAGSFLEQVQSPPISMRDRYDQQPAIFREASRLAGA